MNEKPERRHLRVAGGTARERGLDRGEQLRDTLGAAYAKYAELFRVCGVGEELERSGAERVLRTLADWRPWVAEEIEGIAEGAGLTPLQIAALNARTEILGMGPRASSECSTVTAVVDGRRRAVQTWDWHIELDDFWHTHEVEGFGYRYAGLTEQGILHKIGVNEEGLALHFNILGHRDDGPEGVPMHVLSAVVLSECATVEEALALIETAPIGSSSAFTLIDRDRAVSVEMSPAGVRVFEETAGSVQRTNHFQDDELRGGQKSELYEPDSSERLALIRDRIAAGGPSDAAALVELLVSGEGQPPLTCVPDMAKGYGERWATLATIVTDPERRTVSVLDGMPTAAESGAWRTIDLAR